MRVRFFPPEQCMKDCRWSTSPEQDFNKRLAFPGSSVVERMAVNHYVLGSNPSWGAQTIKKVTMISENWKDKAKCSKDGLRPDFFFPTAPAARSHDGTLDQRQAEVAKYCHGLDNYGKPCPVRTECLEYALATKQDDGVWGGTTEKDRERIKRQRRRKTA